MVFVIIIIIIIITIINIFILPQNIDIDISCKFPKIWFYISYKLS